MVPRCQEDWVRARSYVSMDVLGCRQKISNGEPVGARRHWPSPVPAVGAAPTAAAMANSTCRYSLVCHGPCICWETGPANGCTRFVALGCCFNLFCCPPALLHQGHDASSLMGTCLCHMP